MKSFNWDMLKETGDKEYRKAYIEWMYDARNEFCCADCPHANDGMDKNRGDFVVGPCGQQHCWVTCHCNQVRV